MPLLDPRTSSATTIERASVGYARPRKSGLGEALSTVLDEQLHAAIVASGEHRKTVLPAWTLVCPMSTADLKPNGSGGLGAARKLGETDKKLLDSISCPLPPFSTPSINSVAEYSRGRDEVSELAQWRHSPVFDH